MKEDKPTVKGRVYKFHNITDALIMFVVGIFLLSVLSGGERVSQTWLWILLLFSLLNIRFGVYDSEE